MDVTESFSLYGIGLDEAHRFLPALYFGFLSIWFFSAFLWTINTWNNRHFQSSNLQWTLASLPLIKALQLALSFMFWYSCFNLQICSLWMSFGMYVTGVLFQTASFVSFLLISHGFCIISESLLVHERRTTAALGCFFYLTLVGYRASVPYFTVFMLLNYFISFYVIFHRVSRNLLLLREQLSFVEDEDVQAVQDAVYAKYSIFRKFQGIMLIIVTAEAIMYINLDDASKNYWLRVLVREWAQFCTFLYIGWTFRSQELSPRFSVIPTLKSKREWRVPPIYSLEMDAAVFKDFSSHEWHIGVPTFSAPQAKSSTDSFLFIVQHPHACRSASRSSTSPCLAEAVTTMPSTTTTTTELDSSHIQQQ